LFGRCLNDNTKWVSLLARCLPVKQ
jgi:hypothetical protein